jgi:hypothetical protein
MTNTKHDKSRAYKVHIAGRVRWYANCGFSHRSSVSSRTGTLSEIRPDNMYQPLTPSLKTIKTNKAKGEKIKTYNNINS